MKFSKAWCGLFTTIGGGVGLTAYLANKGSSLCQSAATSMIKTILDTTLNLSGLNTSIKIDIFPEPLQVTLGDISFSLRRALSDEFVETLQKLPPKVNEACNGFIWEQGAIILLVCLGVGGLGIYSYKKFQEQKNTLDVNDFITIDADDPLYPSDYSPNSPRR